jgi:thioester reductase-like protein
MSNEQDLPNLKAEAVLDSQIRFDNPLSPNLDSPKSIFLTGATGFLGAYLLKELLCQTTANIYCLVRYREVETGKQILKKHLQFYRIWQESFDARIIPMMGDLAQPLLGFSQEQFNQLAAQIDIIYHNGSQNNPITSYSQIKQVNVFGTQEILRLASQTQTKPIHFISTVAIFFSPASAQIQPIKEIDFPIVNPGLNTGYKQSKWVAEELIHQAQKRGLPACIYRPTRILGDSKTGIYGKFNNFFLQFIKICIESGKYPAFDVDINLIPVDYASQAILYLSRQQQLFGKTFHLVNPESISWKKLFEFINACGYLTAEISDEAWFVTIEKYIFDCGGEEAVNALLPRFLKSAKIISLSKPNFDVSQTLEGLATSSIACHPVDTSLMSNYLSYWNW